MDELDRKLLSELQSQGFQRSNVLATRLGVGEKTIRRRISNMKNKGIIRIIAMPNPILFGYRAWAKIGIKVELKSLANVAKRLINHPSIYFVAQSLGTWDIIIAVHFDTIDNLTHFVNSELTKISGIKRTETMMLTWPRKYYNFLWPEPIYKDRHPGVLLNAKTVYAIDDIDRKIISMLMNDGLIRPAKLKSILSISFLVRKPFP